MAYDFRNGFVPLRMVIEARAAKDIIRNSKAKLAKIDRQIEVFFNRVLSASGDSVVELYE